VRGSARVLSYVVFLDLKATILNMNNKHFKQLDGLRFYAVLMVIVGHWLQFQWTNPILLGLPLAYGVTLFFVLSGFLITRILLMQKDLIQGDQQASRLLIKRFYWRRILRIFPIYYVLIGIFYVFDYEDIRAVFPWLATYTSNIYQSTFNEYLGHFSHFWSLAVEEQFYLIWPFLMVFVPQRKLQTVICLTIIIALISKMSCFLFLDKWMATAYFTVNCMHALGIGAFLAFITLYRPEWTVRLKQSKWLYLSVVVYILLNLVQRQFHLIWYKEVFDEFVFAVVMALVVLRASNGDFKGFMKFLLEAKFALYSGKISYGMYIYHAFVPALYYWITPYLGIQSTDKTVIFLGTYGLTFLIAAVSWHLIESPLMSLKAKFPYRSTM
jgi:peptidoglycan/LPS O-acetylase OafA/YrhL